MSVLSTAARTAAVRADTRSVDFGRGRAVAYYGDQLGFRCDVFGSRPTWRPENVAQRRFCSLCVPSRTGLPNWRIVDKTWNAYIRVDDVNAIYAKSRSEALHLTAHRLDH
jgi:hypothetical protein